MKILKKTEKIIKNVLEAIEGAPFSLGAFALSFLALILIRLLVEASVRGFSAEGFAFWFFEFSHTFLFFLFAFLCFLPVARLAGASNWSRAAHLLFFGFLIIWTPPILDKIIFGDQLVWSFYELGGLADLGRDLFSFFGDTPDMGITQGVRIEIALMTVGLGAYTFFRSRDILRSVGIMILTYLVFFILGTVPSYLAILALAPSQGFLGVSEPEIAGYVLTPKRFLSGDMADPRMSLSIRMSIVYALLSTLGIALFLRKSAKETFMALLRNTRFPQAIWHGGLTLLGMGLAVIFAGASLRLDLFEWLGILLLIVAVESAWLASVVVNDLADCRIDKRSNADRPLPSGVISETLYRTIGILFFVASLLFSGVVSMSAMLLLLAYQAIALLYSAPPFRLKRIPVVATLLSATAGILVLLAGFFTISPITDISPIPSVILGFLGIAYAVTLPLKDFKDIQGDKKDGVHTLPVLLGAERAKAVIGSALFLCYVASPLVLRESSLIFPALLFGAGAFALVARAEGKGTGWRSFRALPAVEMTLIVVYGILTAILLLF
jgi:4-hydroxybenzoate polyprenyltransferase